MTACRCLCLCWGSDVHRRHTPPVLTQVREVEWRGGPATAASTAGGCQLVGPGRDDRRAVLDHDVPTQLPPALVVVVVVGVMVGVVLCHAP